LPSRLAKSALPAIYIRTIGAFTRLARQRQ
jgi:hypothetical protein